MPIKEAITICKTILRNGFDAYTINANLQEEVFQLTNELTLDIACEGDYDTLSKFFPSLEESFEEGVIAKMYTETGALVRFYSIRCDECAHPDFSFMRISPHMLKVLEEKNDLLHSIIQGTMQPCSQDEAFEDPAKGFIALKGVAIKTLQRDYSLAIAALRLAANYDLPIEATTWLAIIRSSHQIADYLPMNVFMQEMRLVAAENLWRFVQLLSDSFILHAILPEVAALHAVKQQKNKDEVSEVSVFDYTVLCMKHYPEGKFAHDWLGTVAMLFHAIGKLYCAEQYHGRWTFYQYHRVGAQITRAIMNRLNFSFEEIDIVCGMVRNHIRFFSMLTDRGIRRFMALPQSERLIEMTRAHIVATGLSYTNFNHNIKYLERADTPEAMVEPLMNGNEIMEVTELPPGRAIGLIRDALLQAQIEGKVKTSEEAADFVRSYSVEV